jgi:hypothetical protein
MLYQRSRNVLPIHIYTLHTWYLDAGFTTHIPIHPCRTNYCQDLICYTYVLGTYYLYTSIRYLYTLTHPTGGAGSYTLHTAYILSICFNHDHHGVGAGGLLGCWAVPYSYIYIFCLCNRWQLVDVAGANGGIVYTYNIVCICYMCLKIHVCLLYMCACFFLALY